LKLISPAFNTLQFCIFGACQQCSKKQNEATYWRYLCQLNGKCLLFCWPYVSP
jgi:hypothetical protein